jgi:hypothetical protein
MGINQIGGVARAGSNAWQNSQQITLPGSAGYTIPSGNWYIVLGPYTALQYFDSLANLWRTAQTGPNSDPVLVASDGVNYRLKNVVGQCMAGVITAAGSGMNNGVYSTSLGSNLAAAIGNSLTFAETVGTPTRRGTYNLVVGGAINTTITITAAGSGYAAFPTLYASDPPAGGVRATAVCTALTAGGGLSTVTVTNQGAGYTTAPTWTVIPQTGDITGNGAVLTSTLAGSGTLTAMYATDPGAGYIVVPTFTFTGGGSPAATAVMCMTVATVGTPTVTGMAPTSGVYPCTISAGYVAATPIYTNTAISTGLYTPQAGLILANVTGATTMTFGNGVSATNTFPVYGGLHQAIPTVAASFGLYTAYTPGTITMGLPNDTNWLVAA